jgi:flagellar biosynthesis protein FlhF
MAEALAKVKGDLGPNAVILNTRTIRHGGVLGMGGRQIIEITASNEAKALPAEERRSRMPAASSSGRDALSRRPAAEGAAVKLQTTPVPITTESQRVSALTARLEGELAEIRAMIRELVGRPASAPVTAPPPPAPAELTSASSVELPDVPDELREHYTHLLGSAVAEEIAQEVIAAARKRLDQCRAGLEARRRRAAAAGKDVGHADLERGLNQLIPAILVEAIERMLPDVEPVRVRAGASVKRIALVGPTGVGKTTTVAKLAAHFKLREHRRVGLVTTDTYRIGAVDQLRAYADILGLPLEIVMSPADMPAALGRLSDADVVLIDTSGRSQKNDERLAELKTFLTAAADSSSAAGSSSRHRSRHGTRPSASALETHLVLSCTSRPEQIIEVVRKFGVLGIDRVVFSKLDEAVGLGVMLSAIRQLNLKLSYVTTGQEVPDDLEFPGRRRVAELILRNGVAVPDDAQLQRARRVLEQVA